VTGFFGGRGGPHIFLCNFNRGLKIRCFFRKNRAVRFPLQKTGNLYFIPFLQIRYMIKVAINGYGTIGKRVADAVAAQKDMKVIGVSKTRPSAEAFVAKQRGYPLYIADLSKKGSV